MALLPPKVMNFAYGFGAAVVIVGALFKLQHWPGASIMLIVGLLTEALIFGLSAFEPIPEEINWKEYLEKFTWPGPGKPSTGDEESLSKKLDAMLKEAKIDGELMVSLRNSIQNFESAAKELTPSADQKAGTMKYTEELLLAAAQMEALNGLYKVQLESANRNAEANKEIAENATKLQEQMQQMTTNIASLNSVYGGMLSAMNNRG